MKSKSTILILVIAIMGGIIAFLLGRNSATVTQSVTEPQEIKVVERDVPKKQPTIKSETATPKKVDLSVDEVIKQSGDAVVYIATYSKIGLELGQGSGFIISPEGKIATNFHVIENASSASIKLKNGDVYDDVAVIDYDERRDIAILKIKGVGMKSSTLGDSDAVIVGEKVLTIGNPIGLENSVSDGLLSGKRDEEGYKLLQITAPISPGSSGGPVFNMRGDVIGISTMSMTAGQNLNFAVPINYIKPLMEKNEAAPLRDFQDVYMKKKWIGGEYDIAKHRSIVEASSESSVGYLGILFDASQPKTVCKIWSFRKDSPVSESGLMVGDEILKIDDFIVKGAPMIAYREFRRSKKEGDVSIFKVLRNGIEQDIKVKYGKAPRPTSIPEALADEAYAGHKVRLAILVTDITFNGPSSGVDMQEWKRGMRKRLVDETQQGIIAFSRDFDDLSIVDTGKIDVIINDLEGQNGALPPQVRNNVLRSLGVTHIIEASLSRYYETKYFPNVWTGGGEWKDKIVDRYTYKLLNLDSEEIVCIDNMEGTKDFNGKWSKPITDSEDEEMMKYNEEMNRLIKQNEEKAGGKLT